MGFVHRVIFMGEILFFQIPETLTTQNLVFPPGALVQDGDEVGIFMPAFFGSAPFGAFATLNRCWAMALVICIWQGVYGELSWEFVCQGHLMWSGQERPVLFRGEVGHGIFWVPFVIDRTSMVELRTVPAPAGMRVAVA